MPPEYAAISRRKKPNFAKGSMGRTGGKPSTPYRSSKNSGRERWSGPNPVGRSAKSRARELHQSLQRDRANFDSYERRELDKIKACLK
jgi:hypothetical protein